MENQWVIFDLANEHYGLDIASVESIVKMQPMTVVPHAPDFVQGVINLREEVLPVVNLRQRFGLSGEWDDKANKEQRIIIVNVSGFKIGMMVDAVLEVRHLSSEAIEPTSPLVMTPGAEFVEGIAKLPERLVILLNLDRLLSHAHQHA